MERRRALVVAGTLTATLAMAGTAMAVNMGLLGSGSDTVGDLTATNVQPAADHRPERRSHRQPRVRVVTQDIPVAAGGSGGGGGSTAGSVESGGTYTAPAPTAAPAPVVDDHGDDAFDDHGDDHPDGAEEPEGPADD